MSVGPRPRNPGLWTGQGLPVRRWRGYSPAACVAPVLPLSSWVRCSLSSPARVREATTQRPCRRPRRPSSPPRAHHHRPRPCAPLRRPPPRPPHGAGADHRAGHHRSGSGVRLLRGRADRRGVRRRAWARRRRARRRPARRRRRLRGVLGRVRRRSDLVRRVVEQDDHRRRAAAPRRRGTARHRRADRRRGRVGRGQPRRHGRPAAVEQLGPRRAAAGPDLPAVPLPVPGRRHAAGLRRRRSSPPPTTTATSSRPTPSTATAARSGRSPAPSPRRCRASRGRS